MKHPHRLYIQFSFCLVVLTFAMEYRLLPKSTGGRPAVFISQNSTEQNPVFYLPTRAKCFICIFFSRKNTKPFFSKIPTYPKKSTFLSEKSYNFHMFRRREHVPPATRPSPYTPFSQATSRPAPESPDYRRHTQLSLGSFSRGHSGRLRRCRSSAGP